ncbi:MAG: spore cortex-lytic enzyme [Oscillospiraceae bacterium]|jgi:N-acetylmuramoyl-L-alanine amidase
MQKRKLTAALALLFALNIFVIILIQAKPAQAESYRQGSSGDVVRTIQTKLKNWGYYFGAVDGIYGSATTKAVQYFQRQNGLTADGVVGSATMKKLGMSAGSGGSGSSGTGAQANDLYLLAKVISAEARGEPYSGQVAVGAVILNRIKHPSFPSSLSGVVYQPGAFTCMTDGQINQPIADSAYRAAKDAINGSDPSGGAIYYFNPVTATSKWIWSRPLITVIGKHRFCS